MLLHWIWLAERNGLSLREKHALLAHFSDPEDLFAADQSALSVLSWLQEKHIQSLMDKSLDQAEKILEACVKKGIHILTFHDPVYPQLLKEVAEPPVLLYYRGSLPAFGENLLLGIIGTRKASAYGLTTAKRMGHRISRCGAMVVTGLAGGIDSMAAAGALSAGGCVIGVLGCAIDKVYPASNRELYSWVERQGCLISEYPPGAKTYPWNFPHRNRIISGLSQGVLVVEAPEKSGALNTVSWCLEQGRDVFVVPGNIDMASCAGSNALLRQGAIPVTSGWEAVQDYVHLFPDKLKKDETPMETFPKRYSASTVAQPTVSVAVKNDREAENDKKAVDIFSFAAYSGVNTTADDLTDREQAMLDSIPPGEHLTDELIARAGMDYSTALAALTTLTVKGYVRSLPGKRVTRIK